MNQISNLVLINAVISTFYNRILEHPIVKIQHLNEKIMDFYGNRGGKNDTLGESTESDINDSLVETLRWLMEAPRSLDINMDDITCRLETDTKDDKFYLKTIHRVAKRVTASGTSLEKRLYVIISEVEQELNKKDIAKKIGKAYRSINFGTSITDLKDFTKEFIEDIKAFAIDESTEGPSKGFIESFSTAVKGSIGRAAEDAMTKRSTEGSIRLGLRGFDDCMSDQNFIRGGLYCFFGLTGNYKSGMLLDVCRWVAKYNKPYLFNSDKKPLIYRVSYENKNYQDIEILFRVIRENETGEFTEIKNFTKEYVEQYVHDYFTQNGYTFITECFDPNELTVWDLIERMNYWERQGYEIQMASVDYLKHVVKTDRRNVSEQMATNYAFEVIRNHASAKNICLITGHQFNSEAKTLANDSPLSFARKAVSAGMTEHSKTIDTKLDAAFALHIVECKQSGRKWLTIANGKQRGGERVDIKKKSFAYQLHPVGTLIDDVGKPSQAIYNLESIYSSAEFDDDMMDAA